MRNFLRFLLFVAAAACAVGIIYLWKTAAPAPVTEEKSPPTQARPAARLAEMDREFTSLVANVLPSVVSINAIPADSLDPRKNLLRGLLGAGPGARPPAQLGSGAIVSKDGFIVTNMHVIENAGAVQIHLNDGRSLPAKFVGADRIADVAVLKIDGGDLQPLAFGDSDEVQTGQMVIAVGNPFGLQETVTKGIISGKGRRMMSEAANEFFQTDAPINPGNSGGPLVDLSGRIIGVNNAVVQNTDGIGFAIPSNTVRRIFENIRDYGHVVRPWFGVVMLPITPAVAAQLGLPDSKGALVQATVEDSPAARAGLKPGDVILTYNGRPIVDWKDLRNRVAETEPGREVPVGILREGRNLKIPVKIEKQPGE
ncbi:MAG: trypsin-like peptidase domain-containing protein [Terrimicrobiaceae bacterium]